MTQSKTLRSEIKTKRLALSPEELSQESLRFLKTVQAFFENIPHSKRIGIYLAGKGELDLGPSIQWLWQQGYSLYAPMLAGESLLFCEYTEATPLKANQFNLMEPVHPKPIAATDLDYVLVPLVAFDKQGHRLGMGKGYYDRTFAFRKEAETPVLVGCAYAFQEVPAIPAEPHDVSMDLILIPQSNISSPN